MGRVAHVGLSALLAIAMATLGGACKHYVKARTYSVESTSDPKSTYATLREMLDKDHYQAVDQNASAQTVRVRAHADENEAGHASFIDAEVAPDGNVTFRASGSLVRPDGTISTRLSNEVSKLERQLADRLRGDTGGAKGSAASGKESASSPRDTSSAASSGDTGLPRAWNERAYDSKTWGDGEFTCIPTKLPSDGRLLKLRLSTNEEADISISIAYDPGLCRTGCSVPGGCPALGLSDEARAAKLAERIDQGQIDSSAAVMMDGKAVATIDLRKHGSINRFLRQHKHEL